MSVTSTTPPSSSSPKVWLITGCSTGIGRELALAALAHGDFVIATARNICKLEDLVNLGASGIALDVTASDETIEQIVADAAKIHGRIDILVNNAGYTLEGAIEECSETEVYDQFNTNVFGMARMLRAVMPYLRARKSGVVANIGSMAGWCASPAGGWYCATKFAIAGLSEALRFEVAHLGIDVTSVDLGSFRTSLLGGNMIVAKKHIAELDPATEITKQLLASRNGLQAGDPAKAAMLLVEALTKSGRCAGRAIPSRLVVGKDAVKVVGAALQKGQDELNAWADLGATTNFDDIIAAP